MRANDGKRAGECIKAGSGRGGGGGNALPAHMNFRTKHGISCRRDKHFAVVFTKLALWCAQNWGASWSGMTRGNRRAIPALREGMGQRSKTR